MSIINEISLNGTLYDIQPKEVETSYQESGDLYTLLIDAEVTSMAKSGYRIYNNSGTYIAQSYANNTIHYFNPSLIEYNHVLVRCLKANWKNFCYYDPTEGTYTLIKTLNQANAGGLLKFSNVPEGCYLAVSSPNKNWKIGEYKYLARLWINPNYTAKFKGLDESITDKPIPIELSPIDYNGYPYFYIDLSSYENMVVRLLVNASVQTTLGYYASDTNTDTSFTATYFNAGDFSPWIYGKKYLIFFFRTNDFVTTPFNISFGWINPDVAIQQKQKRYFGTALAAHNCDTKDLLVPCCVWADIVDIDICGTADGYFVLIHGTSLNGHDIPNTNLEDMELTYNQMELTDALKIMQMYGTTCYTNLRNVTDEQHATIAERAYTILGRYVVVDGNALNNSSNPLNGHVSKFYCWKYANSIDEIVAGGFHIDKVIAPPSATSETYTYHDWIPTGHITTLTSASDIPQNGDRALIFIENGMKNLLNGDLSS